MILEVLDILEVLEMPKAPDHAVSASFPEGHYLKGIYGILAARG